MQYRMIPRVVDAFRIGIDDLPNWAMDKITSKDITLKSPTDNEHDSFQHNNDTYCIFKNILGDSEVANHGDCIILDENGNLDSLEKSLFDMIYLPTK